MARPGARRATLIAAVAAVTAAAGVGHAEVVKPGEQSGPALGLIGGEIPAILQKAKADPYAAPPAPACETIPAEIAALDQVLGPDADAPPEKAKGSAGHFLARAVRGLIPHRDIVRMVTGAERKDQERNAAAMAGWTRRGYLKGMEVNLGCAERTAATEPTPADSPVGTPAAAIAPSSPGSAGDASEAAAAQDARASQASAPADPGAGTEGPDDARNLWSKPLAGSESGLGR
jgi:hypothetical protein